MWGACVCACEAGQRCLGLVLRSDGGPAKHAAAAQDSPAYPPAWPPTCLSKLSWVTRVTCCSAPELLLLLLLLLRPLPLLPPGPQLAASSSCGRRSPRAGPRQRCAAVKYQGGPCSSSCSFCSCPSSSSPRRCREPSRAAAPCPLTDAAAPLSPLLPMHASRPCST